MTPREWALMAQAAYTAQPDIGLEASAGRVVFKHTPDGLVLSIPGTNNLACAEADAEAIPHDTGALGRVHKGIWDAFDTVWGDVANLDVHALVGHSEGACGALFLAGRLCLLGKPPKIVWAWEPPRASIDNKLRDVLSAHNVELHIMWHGEDIVPLMPPDLLFLNWRHPGPVTRFGKASSEIANVSDHLLENILSDISW